MSDELKQVDVRLKLVEGNGVYSDKPITNPQEAISVMADVMAGLDREEVCVINLDSKGHPINFNVVSIGTLNSSFVSGRELFKSAILSNAASMILFEYKILLVLYLPLVLIYPMFVLYIKEPCKIASTPACV